jgi:hypothetical protein
MTLALGLAAPVQAQDQSFGYVPPVTRDALRRLGPYIVRDERSLNSKVLAFAQSKLGQQVGNGECWTLANEALIAAGAKPANGYTFGQVVTQPVPGDIIQFYNARFESNGSWHQMGSPHHTAIIEQVQGTRITMLHQNVNGIRTVQRMTLDLATKTSGSYTIYRPMPK